jgi:hypothetical protein
LAGTRQRLAATTFLNAGIVAAVSDLAFASRRGLALALSPCGTNPHLIARTSGPPSAHATAGIVSVRVTL